jgi:beta-glucanase (GH16 family)
MAFNDEFEGTSLDLGKWDTIVVCCGGHRAHDEYYLGRNCVVEDGMLREILKRESVKGSNYTSGSITSREKFLHGYFEIRAKFPNNIGVWPAFWANGRRPNHWEIDFLEHLAYAPSLMYYTVHKWTGGHLEKQQCIDFGVDLTDEFHVHGAQWTEDNDFIFYLDGREVARIEGFMDAYIDDIPIGPYPICANLQSSNRGWGPPIDSTTPLPAYYDIDYIRVYQESKASEIAVSGFGAEPATVANDRQSRVTVSADVSATGSAVSNVSFDLSQIGGKTRVKAKASGKSRYTATVTLSAGLSAGVRTIYLTATDTSGTVRTSSAMVTVRNPGPIPETIDLYSDARTDADIAFTADGAGNVSTAKRLQQGGVEGSRCIDFSYSLGGFWWAKIGLHWDKGKGSIDATDCETLSIATKGPGPDLTATVRMVFGEESHRVGEVQRSEEWTSTRFSVPAIARKDGLTAIHILVAGTPTGEGHLYIDNMRLHGQRNDAARSH